MTSAVTVPVFNNVKMLVKSTTWLNCKKHGPCNLHERPSDVLQFTGDDGGESAARGSDTLAVAFCETALSAIYFMSPGSFHKKNGVLLSQRLKHLIWRCFTALALLRPMTTANCCQARVELAMLRAAHKLPSPLHQRRDVCRVTGVTYV
jgi:hypothetical protein